MCGIKCFFGCEWPRTNDLHHRGPDGWKIGTMGKCRMEFNRLAINDLSAEGDQPFLESDSMLICNGEIYNWTNFMDWRQKSRSDCSVLLPMIKQYGIVQTCEMIKGVFAFVWTNGDRVLAARDPFGVRPLFWARNEGGIVFSSETKIGRLDWNIFPPGHIFDSKLNDFVCYYRAYWNVPQLVINSNHIKERLVEAVRRRVINTDRSVGFLLSGGLDSSLVASIATHILGTRVTTFSIGAPNSPDILAARKVAKYINSIHHEISFDFDEAVNSVPNVIRSIESYDTTTVRASTPMWHLSKWISENTDCKVILSGEGADEIFGGYLYFMNAPNVDEFFAETQRRLRLLHQFDVLRSDRCTAAWGLEVRVPFLDRDFVEAAMLIDQNLKIADNCEKYVLRKAFEGWLPTDILWRRKDAFSDAVGYDWPGRLRMEGEKISDYDFKRIKEIARKHNCPLTKEEAWYRQIWWDNFGYDNDHLISEIWRPKWTDVQDPSAQLLHNFKTEK